MSLSATTPPPQATAFECHCWHVIVEYSYRGDFKGWYVHQSSMACSRHAYVGIDLCRKARSRPSPRSGHGSSEDLSYFTAGACVKHIGNPSSMSLTNAPYCFLFRHATL